MNLLDNLTVSAWIKPADLGNGGILSKYDNHGEYNYLMWYQSGSLYFAVGSDDLFENAVIVILSGVEASCLMNKPIILL